MQSRQNKVFILYFYLFLEVKEYLWSSKHSVQIWFFDLKKKFLKKCDYVLFLNKTNYIH